MKRLQGEEEEGARERKQAHAPGQSPAMPAIPAQSQK